MGKMTAERNMRFSQLFESLVTEMTCGTPVNIPLIEHLLGEISLMFRLSKGVTRVYRNPREEQEGGGETMKSFDLGIEGVSVAMVRVVTSVMSIVTMEVFMSPDEEPLSEEERGKVELVMRTTVSFISRNRLRDIVEELAYYDDSGYRNQRSMMAYLSKFYGKGRMDGHYMLHYNLRHFVLVNEEVGREAGDKVLKNHYLAVERIVGERGRVFRLGGDNFVVVSERESLEELIDYLDESSVVYEEGSAPVSITCTVGVFVIPNGYVIKDLGNVMENIITCQRVAQSGVRGSVVFFDDTILNGKERTMRVQQLFPEALRNEEFRVFYQPKVNIETGELCGAEALCRWFRHGKVVPPCDFIPMLEETSDICRLDLYMLDHVCGDIRRWLDEGRKVVRVSVNMSRKHMMNADLLRTITDIIDKHGISHSYVEIELTETTTDVEFSDLKRVVSGLQQKGIYTSVDDFGIGYSSLNLIRAIPWNVLKVDRSFLPTDGEPSDSTESVMFKHVIAMAKELGLECIAEGVETRQQMEILRENGCDIAQGFLFDRPLPVEEFEQRLEKHFYRV